MRDEPDLSRLRAPLSEVTALLWCFDNRADLRSLKPPVESGEPPRYWAVFGYGRNRRRTRDHGSPQAALEEAMALDAQNTRKDLTDDEQF